MDAREAIENLVKAFSRGLGETGYVERPNVAVEYRRADGVYDRVPALAADSVRQRVAVVAATGGAGDSRPRGPFGDANNTVRLPEGADPVI